MSGPAPKPAHLRQRLNRKAGSATIAALRGQKAPALPNPDGRVFHPLTLDAWERAWASEMASQWLPTDADGLGRLALLWDQFYKEPKAHTAAEIRLQEQRFGLSPLDRSRLQWEVSRGEEAERKRMPPRQPSGVSGDPRKLLRMVTP